MGKVHKPLTPEQRERKRAKDRKRNHRLWRESPEYREAHKARVADHNRRKRNESERNKAAHARWSAAAKYDVIHGTNTRNELPADVIEGHKAYKREKQRGYRGESPNPSRLLVEDGIIDPIAVEIAAKGERLVNLTETERVLAVAVMERWYQLSQREMERRLGLSDFTVWYLRQDALKVTDDRLREVAGSCTATLGTRYADMSMSA